MREIIKYLAETLRSNNSHLTVIFADEKMDPFLARSFHTRIADLTKVTPIDRDAPLETIPVEQPMHTINDMIIRCAQTGFTELVVHSGIAKGLTWEDLRLLRHEARKENISLILIIASNPKHGVTVEERLHEIGIVNSKLTLQTDTCLIVTGTEDMCSVRLEKARSQPTLAEALKNKIITIEKEIN